MSLPTGNPDDISIQPDTGQEPPRQPLAGRKRISPEKRRSIPAKRGRRRLWPRLTLAALTLGLVLAAYWLVGFLGVPWYLRQNLPNLFAHDPRVSLETPEIGFNPFTFTLSFGKASISNNGQKIVEIEAARARIAPLPFLRSQLVCRSLFIDRPRIRAVLGENNRYNFWRLFSGAARSEKENDLLNLAELPFHFSLNNIEIFDGQISLSDKIRKNEHVLESVRIDIPHIANIATTVAATVEPRFSAVFNGSPIELKGKPGQDEAGKTTELACTIRNVDIKRYLGYLPIEFPLAVTQGSAEGDLQLTFAPASGDVAVDFQLKLTGLELADKDKSVTVTAPSSHLDGILRPMNSEIAFRNIVTHGFTIATPDDLPWHLTRMLSMPQKSLENGIFSRLLVDNLLADDGSLQRGAGKKNANDWDGIDIRISNYRRTDDQKKDEMTGSYALTARHGETGARLRLAGDFLGGAVSSGDMSIETIPLATLWPWLGRPELSGEGIATFRATLHFADTGAVKSSVLPCWFEKGQLEAKKVSLATWFRAESLKLDGFSLNQDNFSLGKVTLVGGETVLDAAKPPEIFTASFPQVESLDYQGTLTLKDSQRRLPELRFSEAKIQASDLRQAGRPSDKDNVQVQAKLGDKGRFDGRGNVSLSPLKLTLRSDFSDLPTKVVFPWYTGNAFLQSVDLPFSGKGNVLLPGAAFRGEIAFAAGGLPGKKTPYFSWDGLNLYGIRFERDKYSAIIGEMAVKKPRLTVTVNAASPPPAAQLSAFISRICGDGGKKGAMALEIQQISIKDGLITYNDNRLRPEWSGNIGAVNGKFGAFVTQKTAQATSFRLTATLAPPTLVTQALAVPALPSSPVSLTGSIAFLGGGAGAWRLTIADLPIKRFASQVGNFFGIGQDGLVSLDLSSASDGKTVNEETLFTGKNFTAASTKAEAAFLLALLTDKAGKVSWRADISHPADKIAAPVLERGVAALRDQIKKAPTAPFAVAGADDLAENGVLDFTPGQAQMTGDSHKTLGRIRDFLAAHPLLTVEVIGSAGSADALAIKKELEAAENNRVVKENARRAAAWREEVKKQGATFTNEEADIPPPLPAPFAPVKPQAVQVDAAMLKYLAKRRAELARDILTAEMTVKPERVLVGTPKIEKGKGQGRVVFHLRALTVEAKE
ncbi:MAG TPA: hypothetical protein DEB25_01900 [Desulfobulbaceae bacterium]|nr:hypothetical protein [Desulfobulbaceae bacterium]